MNFLALFNNRYKLAVHVAEIVLVLIGIVLALVAIFLPGGRFTRAQIMAISIGCKTLVFIAYQLVTTHVARFVRWKSLKAYMILNILEVVFWMGAAVVTVSANRKYCVGTTCILSKVLVANACILM
ncbi:hypothetical protein MGN70_006335 [Eutypa lata]|nr:hypothetical protein MGN70_006335 [Eutypa lata]